MADRILIFHMPGRKGYLDQVGPRFYMEIDYVPVALRIHAETAPETADLEVNIKDDGTSIIRDRASTQVNSVTSAIERMSAQNTAILPKGENYEDMADSFKGNVIAAGSWVHCEIPADGNARNVTVQLELEKAV